MSLAPELQLPWESTGAEDRLFAAVVRAALVAFLLVAVVVPLLPVDAIDLQHPEDPPAQLARIELEAQPLPPPPPPEPKPRPKPKPIEPPPQAKPAAKPRITEEQAREVAAVAGVLAFKDDLQALRESVDLDALDQTQVSRGEASAARLERSLLTSNQRSEAAGIASAELSRDTGGAALSGRETTRVDSTIAKRAEGAQRASPTKTSDTGGRQGGRSDESIRRVMDRNKGAIFAIYNRALRSDPLLEGKLVFEMVISPSGKITELVLLSSELSDAALTNKLLARIRLIDFGSEEALSTRVNYSFDFLPYG
jgi:outer membrane biosynthesis protein TonB